MSTVSKGNEEQMIKEKEEKTEKKKHDQQISREANNSIVSGNKNLQHIFF
jgi:hypothetical protein